MTTVSVIEWDKDAAAIYRANDRNGTPLHQQDITKYQLWYLYALDVGGAPAFLTAGVTCPPWSGAASARGFWDKRGLLFFWMARLSYVLSMWAALFENVDGLVRHNSGKSLQFIVEYLACHGIGLVVRKLDAALFVAEVRPRVFLHTTKTV